MNQNLSYWIKKRRETENSIQEKLTELHKVELQRIELRQDYNLLQKEYEIIHNAISLMFNKGDITKDDLIKVDGTILEEVKTGKIWPKADVEQMDTNSPSVKLRQLILESIDQTGQFQRKKDIEQYIENHHPEVEVSNISLHLKALKEQEEIVSIRYNNSNKLSYHGRKYFLTWENGKPFINAKHGGHTREEDFKNVKPETLEVI